MVGIKRDEAIAHDAASRIFRVAQQFDDLRTAGKSGEHLGALGVRHVGQQIGHLVMWHLLEHFAQLLVGEFRDKLFALIRLDLAKNLRGTSRRQLMQHL